MDEIGIHELTLKSIISSDIELRQDLYEILFIF